MIEVCRMRLRSRSGSLIWGNFGVALDQLHAIQRNGKLFRDQLGLRGVEPMSQLAFAGESGNAAIGGDGQPTIDLIAAGSIEALGKQRFGRQTKGHHQGTTGFQESASIDGIDAIHAFTP